ncbi:MAG: hypothetical protein KC462_09370 [Cyanobacteria bacterium HKST-UBA05]|nr:hypothetical protein [Cyanobacteria bacterium HKST-UBA05]
MIRPLAILANVMGSLSYFLGLSAFVYWLAQWYSVVFEQTLSYQFKGIFELFLGPFLFFVRQQFGIHYQEMAGHQLDMSLCLLVMVFFIMFMVCLSIGSVLNSVDEVMSKTYRKLEHEFYVWQVTKEEKVATKRDVVAQERKVAEQASLLILRLEHMEDEAFLEVLAKEQFAAFSHEHMLVNDAHEKLIQFSSTFHALRFCHQFQVAFEQLLREHNYFLDEAPYFRAAVQTLPGMELADREILYLRDLLKCVGPNQAYVGIEAKQQLETGKDQQTSTMLEQFMYAGTFYKLGHREFAEAYRYYFDPQDMRRVN